MSASGERAGRVLLGVGIVAAVAALASVLVLFWYFGLPIDNGSLSKDTTIRGGLFLTEYTVSEGGVVLAIPAGMLLVAGCLLFRGYFLTGGRMAPSTGSRIGGSVVATYRVIGTRAHLAWIAVAVTLWVGLFVVPLASDAAGGWPSSVEEDARQYIHILSGIYGGLAAGTPLFFGVTLASGVALVAIGVVSALQFWRGGEAIGSAEGFA